MDLASNRADRVVDIVRARAAADPDQVCLTFYDAHDRADPATYAGLRDEAARFAALFGARQLRPGDPIVLLADSVRWFVSAFLGAQQAGLLAVPVPPPDPLERGRRSRDRLAEIMERSGARGVFSPVRDWLEGELGDAVSARRLPALTPDDLGDVAGVPPPDLDVGAPGRFAYCQFTSGSGGRVKGVLLTHDNVLANIRARTEAHQMGPAEVAVTWLPFFHDMGLVGNVLLALVTGCPCHVISPLRFLTKPASWLALISRVRATTSTGPNLAYGLCARRIRDEEMQGVDLSCWRRAFNGSEPVTREVVEAFIRRFSRFGFDPGAMLPAYGLAETTLTVTSRRLGEGAHFDRVSVDLLARRHRAADEGEGPYRMVASLGRPLPGHEVAILAEDGSLLPARHVGEVAIRGDSVMHGYLPGAGDARSLRPDRQLFSGDLGYMAEGELYLLGRKKDVIIRGGTNYYPEDLEEAASSLPDTPVRRAVAFSVPGREVERVVLGLECRKEWNGPIGELEAAICRAVFARVRFVPDEIVVLAPGTLPLTTSGKVMRPEAQRLYLEGRWMAV